MAQDNRRPEMIGFDEDPEELTFDQLEMLNTPALPRDVPPFSEEQAGTDPEPEDAGAEISFEELERQTTIAESAKNIDAIVQERYLEMREELKKDPSLSRGLSAANSFMLGLTQFVPGAIKTKAVLDAEAANAMRGTNIDPTLTMDYQAGEMIGKQLEEIFPTSPLFRDEFWAGAVAQGAGQMVGQIVASLGTGVLGFGAKAVFAVNSMLTSTLGSQYYEEAKAHGADDDTAFSNMLLNMGGNSALNAIPMALMMRRVNNMTGGSLQKLAKAGFRGSRDEGLTEGMQQWYSNMLAQSMYDETRNLMDGVMEGMAVGAILGATANSVMIGLINDGAATVEAERKAAVMETIDYMFENHADHLTEGMTREAVYEFLNSQENESGQRKVPFREKATVIDDKGVAEPNRASNPDSRSKWRKFADKFLSWAPMNVKELGLIQEHERAWVNSQMKRTEFVVTRLNNAILEFSENPRKSLTKAIEKGEIDSSVLLKIDEALRDPTKMKNLPKIVREPVQQMRDHIDTMSLEFVKRGYVQDKLAHVFVENLGSYVHRAYKLYDPRFEWDLDNIPTDVWNSAVAVIRNDLLKQERAKTGPPMSESAMRQAAEMKLRDILTSDNPASVAALFRMDDSATAIDKGDRNVLLERTDIHPAIRKVMGEFSDPALNYINTIEKMANTIGRRSMYDKMAKEYKGTLFLTKEQARGRDDYQNWQKRLETGTKSELEQLYMHDDMFEALTHQHRPDSQPGWLTALYRFNAGSKYAKTILSHVTVVRNITGGTMFMGFNGLMFDIRNITPAFQSAQHAFLSLSKLDKKGLAEKNIEYSRLNLPGKSVRAGEIKDLAFDAKLLTENPSKAHQNFLEKLATAGKAKGLKRIGEVLNLAADFYKSGDDFVRIWFYELEKARLQEADPSMTDQQVADVVNDIYQNYDRVGRLARGIRRVPLLAPFISFPSEVIRTSANSVKRARLEMASDNPKLRKIGYQRTAGMIGTIAGVATAGLASQMLNRITDEEDQAYREFMPPWDENSIVVYTRASNGVVKYINTSYTNPYAYLMDPVFSLFKGADDDTVMDNFINGLKVLMEPILNEEIFAQAAREVLTNVKAGGGEVFNPQDTLGDKMQKGYLHLWRAMEPGSLTSAKRFIEPMYDRDSKKKPEEELLGLFGLRMITVDVKDSFGFSVREQRQAIRDARRVYNSVKFRPGSSFAEIEDAYEKSNQQYEAIFERMRILVESAQRTGVLRQELEQVMEDSGLSQRDINALRSGVFEPFDR